MTRDRVVRHYHEPPPGPYSRRAAPPHRPHPSALEEELEGLLLELRRLTADRRAFVEDHEALLREVAAGKEELHRLNIVVTEVRSEKEAYMRELVGKLRWREAELRDTWLLRDEVLALRGELERVIVGRKEMAVRLESLTKDIQQARAENEQVSVLNEELDTVKDNLMRARNVVELEKKANMEMVEQRDSMEKNMVSMALEIDKLRTDLANTEARPWGAPGGGPYRRNLSSPGPFLPPYSGTYNLPPGIGERGRIYGEYDRSRQRDH